MGSAKELVVIRRPTAKDTGVGIFNFLPDFSVVDWGPVDQFDKPRTTSSVWRRNA